MKQMVVSVRIPGGDSEASAFADLTHRWLDDFAEDFELRMGEPYEGGNGVLFACDVLVELHGADASWDRFDVHAFERFVREDAPGFMVVLPAMLADLAAFTSYLSLHGRVAFERHVQTVERLVAISDEGDASPREGDASERSSDRLVVPRPNRAERRAAARRARRRN